DLDFAQGSWRRQRPHPDGDRPWLSVHGRGLLDLASKRVPASAAMVGPTGSAAVPQMDHSMHAQARIRFSQMSRRRRGAIMELEATISAVTTEIGRASRRAFDGNDARSDFGQRNPS